MSTRFTRKHAINTYGKAEAQGINNIPGVDTDTDPKLTSDFIYSNLDKLFTNVVVPIQNHFDANGTDIGLTSAYRSKAWNRAVGGVDDSHHTYGYAVDLISVNNTSADIINWCVLNLPAWHQLIWEFPEKGNFNSSSNVNCSWVHVSFIEGNNPKVISLASKLDKLHTAYEEGDTFRRGAYTHYIKEADILKLQEAQGINGTY